MQFLEQGWDEELGSDQERTRTKMFTCVLGTACFALFMLQTQIILMLLKLNQNEIKRGRKTDEDRAE